MTVRCEMIIAIGKIFEYPEKNMFTNYIIWTIENSKSVSKLFHLIMPKSTPAVVVQREFI